MSDLENKKVVRKTVKKSSAPIKTPKTTNGPSLIEGWFKMYLKARLGTKEDRRKLLQLEQEILKQL